MREEKYRKSQLEEEKKLRRDKVAESYRKFVKEYDEYKRDYSELIAFTGRDMAISDWINIMLRF